MSPLIDAMKRERILITVKTYPTLSLKYGELVCTAGVREDGSWVRLYPVPFRLLDYPKRFNKFDWIKTNLVKSKKDHRPESYHPLDLNDIPKTGNLGTEDGLRERRKIILNRCTVHSRLQPLIKAAHDNRMSLAVFKPARILDFKWESTERDWDPDKVEAMRARAEQGQLFSGDDWRKSFGLMPKVPWKFSYRFEDSEGKQSEMEVLDWETSQLYWNCLKASGSNEQAALDKVERKYISEFGRKDLHFFLGTTARYHDWARNPWVIIGVFPIPHERHKELF
jgi:hypothetical protein